MKKREEASLEARQQEMNDRIKQMVKDPPVRKKSGDRFDHFPRITAPTERRGSVYLIRIKGGPVKVGITFQVPFKRVADIQQQIPYEIEVLGFVDAHAPELIENQIKYELDKFHRKGEWYDLTQAQVDVLMARYSFQTAKAYKRSLAQRCRSGQ